MYPYGSQDMLDIATIDSSRVLQDATDAYTIHQYKDYTALNKITLTWVGQSSLAPSMSAVILQIYKVGVGWENAPGGEATNNTANADEDFTLVSSIPDLTDYKTPGGVVTSRVYQYAGVV